MLALLCYPQQLSDILHHSVCAGFPTSPTPGSLRLNLAMLRRSRPTQFHKQRDKNKRRLGPSSLHCSANPIRNPFIHRSRMSRNPKALLRRPPSWRWTTVTAAWGLQIHRLMCRSRWIETPWRRLCGSMISMVVTEWDMHTL